MNNQNSVKEWAKSIVNNSDAWLVLDTETTGLEYDDEIIQLAIVDIDKNILFESRFKPTVQVSDGAFRTHGISNEALTDEPNFVDCYPQIGELLNQKRIAGYNIAFDLQMLSQTCGKYDLPRFNIQIAECAMGAFAEYYGDWNDYFQSYTWKSLTVACNNLEIDLDNAHEAAADTLATVDVIKALAEVEAANE